MQTQDLVRRALHILQRWWWLILLAGLTSSLTAVYLIQRQPRQYVTHTTLMVGTNLRSPNPRENASGISLTLSTFYAELARREPIIERVIQRLNLPFTATQLSTYFVSTRIVPQAQLVEITVLDTNPERAARIANAIAEELIAFSPTSPDKIEEQRRFTQSQINDLETKIAQVDKRIDELNAKIQNMTSAGEIAEAQQRLRELELLKSNDQSTYNGLLAAIDESSVNTLSVFEPATVPTVALPRRVLPMTVLAGVLGLMIGMAAAWLLEDIDDIWRRGRRPDLLLNVPLLGHVATEWGNLVTEASLQLPRGRQCLALRSEVLLRVMPTARYSLMVTSTHGSGERSRLSSDLARLFAHSGQNVMLVDANLGENYLSSTFDVNGDEVQQLLRDPQLAVEDLAVGTDHPNLMLLPGNTGGHSAALVPTLHWPQAVEALERSAELVVFDGPPLLDSADASLLAPHMAGIVVVIDPLTERYSDTRRALARLQELNAPVLGVVMLTYERKPFGKLLRRSASAQVPA